MQVDIPIGHGEKGKKKSMLSLMFTDQSQSKIIKPAHSDSKYGQFLAPVRPRMFHTSRATQSSV